MSGAFLPPVIVKLIADAREFNATTTGAINGVQRIGAAGDTAGKKLGYLGQRIATGIIAGGVAVGVASVKMAGDFESAMTKLVTGAGEAESNIAMIRDGILSLGGQVGQTPAQLAEGMYFIGSAGYHGAEGLKVLQASAQGAAVGGAEMMTVANAVTTVMTNYGLSADQAAGATSGLVRTVSLGKTTLQDLSGALAKVLPLGSAVGISFGEMSGALATMTASGVTADMASEQLRAMISGLISPSHEAKQVLQMIGMTSQTVAENLKNPKVGLAGTLDLIGTQLAKTLPGQTALQTEAFEKLTGGITGTGARLLLTGTHFKTFKNNIQSVTDATKNASGEVIGFDKAQQTLNFKLQALKSQGQGILINLGTALLPTAKALADWATGAIAFFKEHPLISKIAKDSALTAFGLAIAAKIKAGVQGLANLFGFGKAAAQLAATGANTIALDANTAALLGKSVSDVVPKTTKIGTVVNTVKTVGTKVGKFAKLGGAIEAIVPTAVVALADAVGNVPMQTKRLNESLLKKYEPKRWKEIEQLLGGKTELGKYNVGTEASNKGQIRSNIANGAYVGKYQQVSPLGEHQYQTYLAPKGNAAPQRKVVTIKIQ